MSTFSVAHRWRSLARQWPLTIISLGILLSFVWAAVLIWLLICALGTVA
jgi:hypothetical protein